VILGKPFNVSFALLGVWRNEPTHSQVDSNFGSWNPYGIPNFHKGMLRVKIHWIKKFFILLNCKKNSDVSKGSHDPFEYLKHKLWPKERSGVKMLIWLQAIKSQEWPWNKCLKVSCHISLKISWRKLQLCFRPHLNQRSAQEVMAFQNAESPNFGSFGIHNLGVLRQNDIWM
jgi:hypothetical protein